MPLLYETLMAGTFLAAALPDAIVGSPEMQIQDTSNAWSMRKHVLALYNADVKMLLILF